jgi:hypothetical protein
VWGIGDATVPEIGKPDFTPPRFPRTRQGQGLLYIHIRINFPLLKSKAYSTCTLECPNTASTRIPDQVGQLALQESTYCQGHHTLSLREVPPQCRPLHRNKVAQTWGGQDYNSRHRRGREYKGSGCSSVSTRISTQATGKKCRTFAS